MKLLIDVPDKEYNRIKSKSEVNYSEMWIAEGTPLTDLTNGEVLMKMFPKARCNTDDWKNLVWFGITENNSVLINKSWWNAKWGE